MDWTLYIYPVVCYFLFGLCTGSFLNVVIYRLPIKMPISKGRSICPNCSHTLSALDLVPIFSFLFLKRRCRYCGEKISWRYFGVELLAAILFVLFGMMFPFSIYSLFGCVWGSLLIVAAFIDHDHGYIPDRISAITVALAAIGCFAVKEITITSRIIGLVGFLVVMGALYYFTHAVGGGDVKLTAAAGALLGWELGLVGFMLAYLLAAIYNILPLLRKKLAKNAAIRMAPYFAVGYIISMLFGRNILSLLGFS